METNAAEMSDSDDSENDQSDVYQTIHETTKEQEDEPIPESKEPEESELFHTMPKDAKLLQKLSGLVFFGPPCVSLLTLV